VRNPVTCRSQVTAEDKQECEAAAEASFGRLLRAKQAAFAKKLHHAKTVEHDRQNREHQAK